MTQEDFELNANLRQWKEFKDHPCWKDLQQWALDRIDLLREEIDSELDITVLRIKQGAIQNCKDILNVPDNIILELTMKEEQGDQND